MGQLPIERCLASELYCFKEFCTCLCPNLLYQKTNFDPRNFSFSHNAAIAVLMAALL
jgi:hypothetical protein